MGAAQENTNGTTGGYHLVCMKLLPNVGSKGDKGRSVLVRQNLKGGIEGKYIIEPQCHFWGGKNGVEANAGHKAGGVCAKSSTVCWVLPRKFGKKLRGNPTYGSGWTVHSKGGENWHHRKLRGKFGLKGGQKGDSYGETRPLGQVKEYRTLIVTTWENAGGNREAKQERFE